MSSRGLAQRGLAERHEQRRSPRNYRSESYRSEAYRSESSREPERQLNNGIPRVSRHHRDPDSSDSASSDSDSSDSDSSDSFSDFSSASSEKGSNARTWLMHSLLALLVVTFLGGGLGVLLFWKPGWLLKGGSNPNNPDPSHSLPSDSSKPSLPLTVNIIGENANSTESSGRSPSPSPLPSGMTVTGENPNTTESSDRSNTQKVQTPEPLPPQSLEPEVIRNNRQYLDAMEKHVFGGGKGGAGKGGVPRTLAEIFNFDTKEGEEKGDQIHQIKRKPQADRQLFEGGSLSREEVDNFNITQNLQNLGLCNFHGTDCFMNAAVQTLVGSKAFMSYFDKHKVEAMLTDIVASGNGGLFATKLYDNKERRTALYFLVYLWRWHRGFNDHQMLLLVYWDKTYGARTIMVATNGLTRVNAQGDSGTFLGLFLSQGLYELAAIYGKQGKKSDISREFPGQWVRLQWMAHPDNQKTSHFSASNHVIERALMIPYDAPRNGCTNGEKCGGECQCGSFCKNDFFRSNPGIAIEKLDTDQARLCKCTKRDCQLNPTHKYALSVPGTANSFDITMKRWTGHGQVYKVQGKLDPDFFGLKPDLSGDFPVCVGGDQGIRLSGPAHSINLLNPPNIQNSDNDIENTLNEWIKDRCTKKQPMLVTGFTYHSGEIGGGHYIAYLRRRLPGSQGSQWYEMSDDEVSLRSEQQVQEAFKQAYLITFTAADFFNQGWEWVQPEE